MRLVIKVGTNVLTNDSEKVQESKIKDLIGEIFDLVKKNYEVMLVSSGAIACGRENIPDLYFQQKKQVWAAIGQPLLMEKYHRFAKLLNLTVSQCLVLRGDFTDRERYNSFVGTLEGLLKAKVLPIINENDVMATNDLTVGDNDFLAAMVAVAINADKLIILTNQKGLFSANPDIEPKARLIREVENIDFHLEKFYSNQTSTLGRGGMLSKVRAAKHAVHAGVETFIADGREEKILHKVLSKPHAGTRFFTRPSGKEIGAQKRWLMSAKGFGQLIIDEGAVRALKDNKSLLLPGIIAVKGLFDKGEIVEIISKSGAAIAYGKVNYNKNDIQKVLTLRKSSGQKTSLEKEVVHRDYMVALKN